MTLVVVVLGLGITPAPAQVPSTRILTGTVLGSVTGQPVSGAIVIIERTSKNARSDSSGRFLIRDAPVESFVVRTMAIGYRPQQQLVTAGSDSLDLLLHVTEPRPRSPVTGSLPPLTVSEQRVIWAALLRGLAGLAEESRAHLSEVSRAVPRTQFAAPSVSRRVVLHVPPGSLSDLDSGDWQTSLIDAGVIEGVCRSAGVLECPQEGFRLFATPAAPGRYATDSVTVRISFTLIDAAACRQGRSVGDHGMESHYVVRAGAQWRYDGIDDTTGRSIGGTYCGASMVPERKPN